MVSGRGPDQTPKVKFRVHGGGGAVNPPAIRSPFIGTEREHAMSLYAGTFSIVAHDPVAGVCGVAVASRMPAIGALTVFAHADVGAVATQALINPLLGVDALELLRTLPADEALTAVLADDPEPDSRQVAVVDRTGRAAAHTGFMTHPWCGHRTGEGYAVAGNILTGGGTLDAMAEAWESGAALPFDERLLRALEAGQAAGGDRRGRQSAALYVHTGNPYPHLDLRVDEHTDPVAELRRVHGVARRELLPFVEALPTRENPAGAFDRLHEEETAEG